MRRNPYDAEADDARAEREAERVRHIAEEEREEAALAPGNADDGVIDCFGYRRWTATSCRRCGYEKADCTCIGGFCRPKGTANECIR